MLDNKYGKFMGDIPQGEGKPNLEVYLDGVTMYFVEDGKLLKTAHTDDLESLLSSILA